MAGVIAPVLITAICLPFMVSRRWTMFWQKNGVVMETATWETNAQHHLALPSWVDALVIALAAATAIATAVFAARLSSTQALFDDAPAATNETDDATVQAAPSVTA
jgi:preprotein translocase subunit SecY